MEMNLTITADGVTEWRMDYAEETKTALQTIEDVLRESGHLVKRIEFEIKLASRLRVDLLTGKALPVKLSVLVRPAFVSTETMVEVASEVRIAETLADLIRLVDPVFVGEPLEISLNFFQNKTYVVR
jgi:hypothetical protein